MIISKLAQGQNYFKQPKSNDDCINYDIYHTIKLQKNRSIFVSFFIQTQAR